MRKLICMLVISATAPAAFYGGVGFGYSVAKNDKGAFNANLKRNLPNDNYVRAPLNIKWRDASVSLSLGYKSECECSPIFAEFEYFSKLPRDRYHTKRRVVQDGLLNDHHYDVRLSLLHGFSLSLGKGVKLAEGLTLYGSLGVANSYFRIYSAHNSRLDTQTVIHKGKNVWALVPGVKLEKKLTTKVRASVSGSYHFYQLTKVDGLGAVTNSGRRHNFSQSANLRIAPRVLRLMVNFTYDF